MNNNSKEKYVKVIYMKNKKSVIKSINKKDILLRCLKRFFLIQVLKYIGEQNIGKVKSNRIIDIILNKKKDFFIGSTKEIIIDKYKNRLEYKRIKIKGYINEIKYKNIFN